jgi:hypothetical protein
MKKCTYPMGYTMCHLPATSALKGEGSLYWYRCDKHRGMKANGDHGIVLVEGVGL